VNKSLLVSPLNMVLAVVMMVFAGGSFLHFDEPAQFDQVTSLSRDRSLSGETTNETTCGSSDAMMLNCEEMEQKILSTTLRIEIKTSIIYVEGQGYSSLFSNGHGTVMGGRYLLTHNHFRLPLLELLADDFNGKLATITLYTADGNLLWQGPLTTAAVAFEDSETLLLEFLDKNGQGLFGSLGIRSADFAADGSPQITAGASVAQVNWDNEQATVQWTRVKELFNEAGTPVLQLADCIIPGSSGGGVFFKGEHLANNWIRSMGCVEGSNDVSLLYSTAALNSAELLAAGHHLSEQG
jgi:hypothetical protein